MLGLFCHHFTEGDNICGFMFASPFGKGVYSKSEEFVTEEQTLSLRRRPLQTRATSNISDRAASLATVFILLKACTVNLPWFVAASEL